MKIEFRRGEERDVEDIVQVMSLAFNRPADHPRYAQMKRDVQRSPGEYQVLTVDGRVRGVVHIRTDRVRTGRGVVLKADVGHVSIAPEWQGQGLGSAMMRHGVKFLRREGYDLARLGGYAKFYARFGWEPFPRRYVEFQLADAKAGAAVLSVEELLRLPDSYPGELRAYDDARDRLQRWQAYERFNHERAGALVVDEPSAPDPAAAPPAPDPLRIVYERDGLVRGYVFAYQLPGDLTPFEAPIVVSDFACDLDQPQAAGLLLKRLLLTAHERGVSRVTARLPFDDRLLRALQDAGLSPNLRELHAAPACNMIRVVRLASFLEHLAPDLERRLAASAFADWTGAFVFDVGGQTAALRFAGAQAAVEEGDPGDALHLALGHAEFVALAFGYRSFDETRVVCYPPLDARARGALQTLFPRQPAASGPLG